MKAKHVGILIVLIASVITVVPFLILILNACLDWHGSILENLIAGFMKILFHRILLFFSLCHKASET